MKVVFAFFLSIMIILAGCQPSSPLSQELQAAESKQETQVVDLSLQEAQAVEPKIVQLITTFTANFALTSSGEIYSWGKNDLGVLGLGLAPGEIIDSPTKIQISVPIVKLISNPNSFTVLAISENGEVYGWGSNRYKTISSEEKEEYNSPIKVDYGISIEDIKLSSCLVTIIGHDKKVYGCGWLQDGSSIYTETGESFLHSDHNIQEIPLKSESPIKQIENSDLYRAFLNTQGQVFLQGVFVEGITLFPHPSHISFPEPIVQIATMYQGLIALSETGNLYFVGEDRFGILGDDSSEYYDLYQEPVLIDKIDDVANISVSSSSIIAQTNDGSLFTWGYNLRHNSADSDDEVITVPSQLECPRNIEYYYCGEFSSVCISSDEKIYVWGSNVRNLHLNSNVTEQYKPTQINFWFHVNKKPD